MALYNSPYPATYNNPYQPYTPPMNYAQVQQSDTSIIWVQGESGAKAYPVQSGKSVVLFDSESDHFFIKTTDTSGMPQPLRIFTYHETSANDLKSPEIDTSNFVTREEFDAIKEEMSKLKNRQSNPQYPSNQQYQRRDGVKNGKQIIQRTDE